MARRGASRAAGDVLTGCVSIVFARQMAHDAETIITMTPVTIAHINLLFSARKLSTKKLHVNHRLRWTPLQPQLSVPGSFVSPAKHYLVKHDEIENK